MTGRVRGLRSDAGSSRTSGPDHRASWKGSPPPLPGWATKVVRSAQGGPDPLPMPKAPKK